MLSTSGRSSRSTLMFTNSSFITAATAGSSNDSWAITWHQWQAEYPTLRSTGLSSARARPNASSPHGYQSTGLPACWRRYGLVSWASRFISPPTLPTPPVFGDLSSLCSDRSAKSRADLVGDGLGVVDRRLPPHFDDVPAQGAEQRASFFVAQTLPTRRMPLGAHRLDVDHALRVRQIQLGDGHAVDNHR